MEIFLPSLIIFVLLGFFIFLILPRMGPLVLGIISLIALVAAGIHHYSLFHSEYKLSTWQYSLAAYTPWVVLAVSFVFVITAAMAMFSGPETKAAMLNTISTPIEAVQEAVTNSYAAMPSAASATNSLTAAFNRGINAIPGQTNTTNAAMTSNMNANANKNKKTPNIPGLGFSSSQV